MPIQVAEAYAKGVAEAYSKVGNITMYGGRSGKLAPSVIEKTAQLPDGLSKGIGIGLKSLLASAFGAKVPDSAKKDSRPRKRRFRETARKLQAVFNLMQYNI